LLDVETASMCAGAPGGATSCTAAIVDGTIETARGPYHSLLMLPLEGGGPVRLKFEFFSGAASGNALVLLAVLLTVQREACVVAGRPTVQFRTKR
jgi:hypothetical protein